MPSEPNLLSSISRKTSLPPAIAVLKPYIIACEEFVSAKTRLRRRLVTMMESVWKKGEAGRMRAT
jgi:hypothetical protein